MSRPRPHETDEFYHEYIRRVPDGDIIELLERQVGETAALLTSFGEERGGHRYAAAKWSVKEVAGHVIDAERMFGYRAFHIARGDPHPLPSFDQGAYVERGAFGERSLAGLTEELRVVRAGHVALCRTFSEAELQREGVAAGCSFTVRGLLYIMAGHELHHGDVLRERYS